ncbi:MAG: HAMP domain-containing protein [Streptomycetaceae bacterium]|nr:HAMP domain-containing protein [Streptomycetaceae bacterium]NUS57223.1 HAMP domain-containing protein [Streptomycetaceae bacterium]
MTLFWRIFLLNAAVLVAAALLLLGPVTVSSPVLPGQALVVVSGLASMLVLNALILRYALAPLRRLTGAMSTTDLLRPGARTALGGSSEMAALVGAFNAMLDRLEAERATSSARVVSAQEEERRRVARELHDEVGQALTVVLLQLKHVSAAAPADLRAEIASAQEITRESLDEIRRIARHLRPGVLEDLGLGSALRALAHEFGTPALTVSHAIEPQLPALGPDAELAVYRVAQEALTNTVRHSGADRAVVRLHTVATADATTKDGTAQAEGHGTTVELCVRDNGTGIGTAPEGAGIRGMRERALLAGARLTVTALPDGGTEIRLRLTAAPRGPAPTRADLQLAPEAGQARTQPQAQMQPPAPRTAKGAAS